MVALLGLSSCSLLVRKNDGGQEWMAEVRRDGREEAGRRFSWLRRVRGNDAVLSAVISPLLTERVLVLTEIDPTLSFLPGTGGSGMTAEAL